MFRQQNYTRIQGFAWSYKSIHQRFSIRKNVLRKLTKFTGKYLCNFIQKEALEQVFSCKFCKISKKTFFAEHLCTTASDHNIPIYGVDTGIYWLVMASLFWKLAH